MNRGLGLIGSFGLGAGLAYFFDPEMGDRRRAVVRDKLIQKIDQTTEEIESTLGEVQDRVKDLLAQVDSRLQNVEVDDQTLLERVRAKLRRVISHPDAIEVRVENKRVILTGPILAAEIGPLLSAVALIRGVADVDNQLQSHQTAENVPALQGGEGRSLQLEWMQGDGSSTARMLMGAAGVILALYGIRRDGIFRTIAGTAGVGILTRSITNRSVREIIEAGSGFRAVNIQKTVFISAPVEKVFEFWDHFQNFPKFMSNVREVHLKEEGRSHWVVAGPGGVSVEWDAVITERIPNSLIAWKTVPGATVAHTGSVRFEPASGGTRVEIQLSYNPPAGVLGHAVASLFGADPKSEMDTDLVRMKTLIETGGRPQDAAA
ncbi:MAG: SRPBCC family protein [Nitrospirae bacterium]|nr:SRPBCC family protein [Candidatus Manganitrophaceae bacterium]